MMYNMQLRVAVSEKSNGGQGIFNEGKIFAYNELYKNDHRTYWMMQF